MLCALVAGRLTLPIGGRGTDRDAGEGEEVTPPNLAAEGSDIDLTAFWGRGMFWFIAVCGPGLPFRPAMVELFTPRVDIAAVLELPRLCGGRGTKRPAGAGRSLPLFGCPSGARFAADVAAPRAVGVPAFCKADGLAEFAGGVILLTVGREAIAEDGLAAGRPAFGPSTLPRVGETSGLPMLERFRKALGETRAPFRATGSPRSRVLRDAAVRAPVLA